MATPSLDSLPNEVLYFICSYLKPYWKYPRMNHPIEQLARTSKRLRSVAIPFMLKERYENVKDDKDLIVPLVLRDILRNPGLAQYVRHLSIQNRRFGTKTSEEEESYYDNGEYEQYYDATMDLIQENLDVYGQAIRAVVPERMQEKWVQAILMGNDEPLIGLLILHCPLLETIDWEVNLMHETLYFFDYLKATAMNPEVRPTMSIKEVSMSRSLERYEYSEGLLDAGYIQPILALPSLENLNLENVQGDEWLSDAPPKPSRYSNLKSLDLRGCSVTAEIIEGFCSAAIALESLVCERKPICQPMTPESDSLFVFFRAIEKGAGHSLKSLYIDGTCIGKENDEDFHNHPSLNKSLALTDLRMDATVFENEFKLRLRDGQIPVTRQPRIGSYMPPNLETLVLDYEFGPHGNPPNWKFVDRLLDLLTTKDQFTPNLKCITMHHYESRRHLGWNFPEITTPEIQMIADSCGKNNVNFCLQATNHAGTVSQVSVVEQDSPL